NTAGFTFSNFWPGSERTAIGIDAPSNTTDGHASSVIARTLDVPSGPTWTHCDSTLAWAAPPPDNARATAARMPSRPWYPKFMVDLSRGAGMRGRRIPFGAGAHYGGDKNDRRGPPISWHCSCFVKANIAGADRYIRR